MAKQTILLYLHSIEPSLASWVVLDEQDAILQITTKNNLADFPSIHDQEIIAIIPAQDILITEVELPKLSHHRLLQALPFALEEQLIDDVSELHFAIGDQAAENRWPTAVISHQKMTQWLELLKQYRITPAKIIPAPLALPLEENHWTLYLNESLCHVRTHVFSGFTCDTENLAVYLHAKLTEAPEKPAQLDVYADETQLFPAASHFPIPFEKMTTKNGLVHLLKGIRTRPYIDLLQGIFRGKRQAAQFKKFWIYAVYFALASIVIGFCSNLLAILFLYRQETSIQNKIAGIYKHHFPNATTVIAPKQRMEEKLKKTMAQASNESFLILLAHTGKAFSQSSGIQLQNLDYRGKRLSLDVSANSFDNLDNLTQLLQQEGLTVKEQNAETIAARVKATLLITIGDA